MPCKNTKEDAESLSKAADAFSKEARLMLKKRKSSLMIPITDLPPRLEQHINALGLAIEVVNNTDEKILQDSGLKGLNMVLDIAKSLHEGYDSLNGNLTQSYDTHSLDCSARLCSIAASIVKE